MPLTGKQRQHLRALAHHLEPVVQVGHEGLTEAVEQQIREALLAHELIKVRVGQESPIARDELAQALEERGIGEVPQTIGRIVVVWKRRPKKPKVDLKVTARKARGPGEPGEPGKPKTRLSLKARSKGAPHLRKKKRPGRRPSRGKV